MINLAGSANPPLGQTPSHWSIFKALSPLSAPKRTLSSGVNAKDSSPKDEQTGQVGDMSQTIWDRDEQSRTYQPHRAVTPWNKAWGVMPDNDACLFQGSVILYIFI